MVVSELSVEINEFINHGYLICSRCSVINPLDANSIHFDELSRTRNYDSANADYSSVIVIYEKRERAMIIY